MENLDSIIGTTGGLAGVGTTVWNYITSRNNKEMLQKQEEKIDFLKENLANHKTEVAKDYVSVKRFEKIETKIDKIYEHLMEK